MPSKHKGSTMGSFFAEEGLLEEVELRLQKRSIVDRGADRAGAVHGHQPPPAHRQEQTKKRAAGGRRSRS